MIPEYFKQSIHELRERQLDSTENCQKSERGLLLSDSPPKKINLSQMSFFKKREQKIKRNKRQDKAIR